MPGFNLADYEPVQARLAKFWSDHPDGRIVTTIVPAPEGQWIVRTEVWRDVLINNDVTTMASQPPDATGYAQEVIGQGNVNKTSALENCETSSIGRALANLGYATTAERASREEMSKVRGGASPAPSGQSSSTAGAPTSPAVPLPEGFYTIEAAHEANKAAHDIVNARGGEFAKAFCETHAVGWKTLWPLAVCDAAEVLEAETAMSEPF